MSETEPIPPTSSVTALRIPIIKKGEYDLWSMKMRQYIAITDHILWDIITNGNQTTTDPASPSVSAPKTSLAANARRNNEKALNILLSAIPDRHLLSFHDAVDARSLWKAIKARFGGNEASKKMQKNLLKQQFETFTIGSREELDSAYERFQHILSMLELHDATVSIEDANLKFLRSLPSVWHVVATMIRGQPGLDELDFDDLYNNLKVYEHELKGVSNSNSQNIAFLSTEVKGSTLKQSTAEPTNIPKGYTQAASSKVPTAPNYASHSDEIICSFFAQQASMPTTHDDEDLLQIDEDAMEEIDIRWQVAMITARIRKFMRKTGRPIDLKPKNGITFDKSKIECFNCQKLGHFARECRFAKYQENRANGRQEKKIVAIEDSNSKALVATDNNEDIDWTKEFDAEPVTYAMMALTGVEQDDWSIEFDAEHMHFGQDGLDDFDWSNKADDAPVSLALMATNSEVPYCSKCSKSYKKLLESYQTERDNFQRARTEILGYQMSLESLEVMLKTHEKNEYAWGDKYEQWNRLKTLIDSAYENSKEKSLNQQYLTTGTIYSPRAKVSLREDEPSLRNKVIDQEKTKASQSALIGNPEEDLKDYDIIDSGCSGSMTGDKDKCTLVLFTDKECLILSPKFKFVDEDLVILRAPRKNDVYSLDLKNIIPSGGITCLIIWVSLMASQKKDICWDTYNCNGFRVYNRDTKKGSSLFHVNFLGIRSNQKERIAFEEEKRGKSTCTKGKEHVDSTFTLSTANTPPQSTGNTPTDSDDDTSKDGIFSTNSFDAEEGGVADYNNMDTTLDLLELIAIRLLLHLASFMGFILSSMDVKSALFVWQIQRRAWYRRGAIDKTLFIKRIEEISVGTGKDEEGEDVDISSHSRFLQSTCCQKGSLVTYDGDNHDRRSTLRRMSISWETTSLLAMQENKQLLGYHSTEGRICSKLHVVVLRYAALHDAASILNLQCYTPTE
ncbi:ribonuclease H-like domain-containing protein [Tanacetum coccineum]